jgi:hypothetical protein
MTQNTSADQIESVATSAPSPTIDAKKRCAVLGKQALLAFWRDLPQLIQERPWQWVAYHGDRQLGFADTRVELWQECLRQGLQEGEFIVRSIEPEDQDLVLDDA